MSVGRPGLRGSARALRAAGVVATALVAAAAPAAAPRRPLGRPAAPALEVPPTEGDELATAVTSSAAATGTVATVPHPDGPRGPLRRTLNYYALLPRALLVDELERRHAAGGTLPERLERLTRGLVGAPYVLSPLGEEAPPDLDPRFRLDAFDCTTLVETALALLRCDALADIARELDRIRYRGAEPSYARRRHLVTAQWIPELVAAGDLEDVTAAVGGDDTAWIHLRLDAARWAQRRVARAVALDPAEVPAGTFSLPYIPLAAARRRADAFPAGTVLDVVRSDWPGAPEVITHQGLIVRRPGEATLYVRHASPVARRVIDEPLDHMLARYAAPKPGRAWPVVGVHLLRVLDPGKTAAAASP